MRRAIAAVVVLSALGAGCVHYRYVPPKTPEGKACVMEANKVREMCRGNCGPEPPTGTSAWNDHASCNRRCTTEYHEGYKMCGGRVIEESGPGPE